MPDNPDGYGLKAPDKLPAGIVWRDDHAKQFAAVAHELALTPAQVQRLSTFQMELTSADNVKWAADARAHDEAQDKAIREAFGDKLEQRMIASKRVALGFFGNENGPQTRSELILGLARIADAMSEDKLPSGEQVANKLGPEAMAKQIQSDPTDPYNDQRHPRHKERVAYVKELMAQAYPEK